MLDDSDAWKKYPKYHNWFNKLWLSEKLGHKCGPCGVAPDESGQYIVRPTYNLSGMGLGAEFKFIEARDSSKVPPGYFWQEMFIGPHYSASYEFVHDQIPYWRPLSCFQGIRMGTELWRFSKWVRSSYVPNVSPIFNELSGIKRVNIEFKGDVPIEVHLRDSPDPEYDEFIPIWKDSEKEVDKYVKMGYTYIESYDDADGFLKMPRLGFVVINKGDYNE